MTPDRAFYRSLAETRARQRRHMRRKALLRWLLSREVRIAIAALLAGLVILASAFAGQAPGGVAPRSLLGRDVSCFRSGHESGSFGAVAAGGRILGGESQPSRAPAATRTPVQAAKILVAAYIVLALALALGSLVVVMAFRLAREAERAAEGRVTPREPWK